ncbi:transposase for insertion sequence element [Escherichia coli M605]|uniref:Transposase for insertion sequence element n=1 Tax=Escherichia coli M605 TaxID=656417 RepID=F4SYA6_ECOLX|nr:transposase for insertion sequence element [Escherichia coli M605]
MGGLVQYGCWNDWVISRRQKQKRHITLPSEMVIWQPEFTDKTLSRKNGAVHYEQFGDLKYKYRNREFWCRGYYVDTVGKNTAKIQDYIKHQLEEDKMGEQLSIPYPGSPFTGRK